MKKILYCFFLFVIFLFSACGSSAPEGEKNDMYFEEEDFLPPGEMVNLEHFLGKPVKKSHTSLLKNVIKDKKVLYYIDWSWQKILDTPWDSMSQDEQRELESLKDALEEILIKEVEKQGGKLERKENARQYASWEWFKTYSTTPQNIREFWVRANCIYRNSDGKCSVEVFLRHLKWDEK